MESASANNTSRGRRVRARRSLSDATATSGVALDPAGSGCGIEVDRLCAAYDGSLVLDQLRLSIPEGEVTALCGPSGCGKSTLLRVLAGLHRSIGGTIDLGGRRIADERTFVQPERRGVGLVFQDGALFAHLNVAANIGFGLPRGERTTSPRIAELIEMVGLTGLQARFPHELSGGQRQRVAIARALAPRPTALLLDEPFANLDAVSRRGLRTELAATLRAERTTVLFVTHDREEAWSVASSIAVMNQGRIEHHASPDASYSRPATEFVARFLGDLVQVPRNLATDRDHRRSRPDDAGTVEWIRPENIGVFPSTEPPPEGSVPGTVMDLAFDGATTMVHVSIDGTETASAAGSATGSAIGSAAVSAAGIDTGDARRHPIAARVLSPAAVRPGDRVTVHFPIQHRLVFRDAAGNRSTDPKPMTA
jgi:iron(III) transport system ATP-binding protein